MSSPFCSLSLLVVTQIRGHIAGSSAPLPTTLRALHFYREKISALSSLVDSRRIVLTHARRSQQLILFFFCKNTFKISPRRDSNSRTNTSSIRGLPLVHPGDLCIGNSDAKVEWIPAAMLCSSACTLMYLRHAFFISCAMRKYESIVLPHP